ncbi:MAG: TerC family protein [Dactylosporangium sp.]|nr:TerC family protein [Dactylosporangium sp.]NNJ63315.1 TerC family protein [Dactylosporangium sp.]
MNVPGWVWLGTLVVLGLIMVFDLIVIGRRPHEPSMRESTMWVLLYVSLAVLFGAAVWITTGGEHAGQFYAGWLTEYSLSIDNLFVFVIIMSKFAVPREYQQKLLLIGIVLALLLRGTFIAAGAAVVSRFSWVFYLFGAFLVYTAIKLARHGQDDDEDFQENGFVRFCRRMLPLGSDYNQGRMTQRLDDGRLILTPVLIVLVAISTTDLVFALDSIPAVFGLTKEPYLVFTVNVFALMGLRQLYFLLGHLLDRLVYLSTGLAVILGFVGAKLITEALHENQLPFINGGDPVAWAPKVPVAVSLGVVAGALVITTIASLLRSWNSARGEVALVRPLDRADSDV